MIRNLKLAAAVCLIVLTAAVPISAGAQGHPGPHWTAANFLAMHPGEQAEIRLSYEAAGFDDNYGSTFVIGISEQYAYVETEAGAVIFDFAAEQNLQFDRASHRFTSSSLYAIPAFALYEVQNRMMMIAPMAELLQDESFAAQLPLTAVDQFWIESDVGVAMPGAPAPEITIAESADGSINYSYDGTIVATAMLADTPLPPDAFELYLVVLRRLTKLHPVILADLAGRGGVLASLTFAQYQFDGMTHNPSVSLQNVEERTAPYPLPADAVPHDGDNPLVAGLIADVRLVTAQPDQRFRSDRDYQQAALSAAGKGEWLAAFLTITERHMQFGTDVPCSEQATAPQNCFDMAQHWDAMSQDAALTEFQRTLSADPSVDPAVLVETLNSFDRSTLSNPAIVDLMIANIMSSRIAADPAGAPAAEKLFVSYISSNPYVGSAYSDLGQHYWRQFQLILAWQMFDLARAFGRVPGAPMIENIYEMEQRIRTAAPEYFG